MVKAIATAMLKVLVAAQVKVNQERGYTLLEYCAGAAILIRCLPPLVVGRRPELAR